MSELYGSDAYAPSEVALRIENVGVAKARAAAGAEADAEVVSGVIMRVGDAVPIETSFVETVNTRSMFGGKRVLWLRNFNWVSDSVQARSEEVKESLARLLTIPCPLRIP